MVATPPRQRPSGPCRRRAGDAFGIGQTTPGVENILTCRLGSLYFEGSAERGAHP